MKVYLAHSISTKGEFEYSKKTARKIRSLGYKVYAPAENDGINDKTNNPTPTDIYYGDIKELLDADVLVVNLSGGHQDGTISEIGVVAGINIIKRAIRKALGDRLTKFLSRLIKINLETTLILAYTTNARLIDNQTYKKIPSASANHLVLGMIERWGSFLGDENRLFSSLKILKNN